MHLDKKFISAVFRAIIYFDHESNDRRFVCTSCANSQVSHVAFANSQIKEIGFWFGSNYSKLFCPIANVMGQWG